MKTFSSISEEIVFGFTEEEFEVTGQEQYEDWGEDEEEVVFEEDGNLTPQNHLKRQPPDVQRKIKYHLQKGKSYWEAFKAAKIDSDVNEEVNKNKKVKLNKPFLTPQGPKKRSVYVKNDKGNVVKVNFGDPNMRIRKSNPDARRSFRARHGCDVNPGPRWKAKYWSCKAW